MHVFKLISIHIVELLWITLQHQILHQIKMVWLLFRNVCTVTYNTTSVDQEFINPVKLTDETDEVVQRFLLSEYRTVYLNALSSNLIFASGLKLIEKIGEGKQ